jgi:hypothetical protein
VTFNIITGKVGTGADCPFPDGTNWTEACGPSEVSACPLPCIDTFSNWTVCDCYNKTQFRNYSILQNAANGGTPCQYNSNFTSSQSCTPDASQNCPVIGPSCVTAADCNDGRACTVDRCVYLPLAASYHCDWSQTLVCNDSSVCTSDVCDEILGCVYSEVLFCNDNNACTNDFCDNVTGCQHTTVVCPDYDVCNLGTCDPTLGCGLIHRDCSSNFSAHDNCTAIYCDVNHTQHGYPTACVEYNICAGSPGLVIGLSAGIVAGIIILCLFALAVCSGSTYAVASNVSHLDEAPVLANPLYQGTGKEGHNALYSGA